MGEQPTSPSPRCRRATRHLDFQLSGFTRYSSLSYQPDAFGDLLYNGIAPWTKRTSFATGVQGDGSWKVAKAHTLRGGFLVQRERATSFTNGNTLPLVPDPDNPGGDPIPSDQPFGFTDGSDLTGWTYSVYLQDEWRIVPTVTVNFGLRFDAINGATAGEPAQPARQRRVAARRRCSPSAPAIRATSRRRRSCR